MRDINFSSCCTISRNWRLIRSPQGTASSCSVIRIVPWPRGRVGYYSSILAAPVRGDSVYPSRSRGCRLRARLCDLQ